MARPIEEISSPNNPLIKLVRSLALRKHRQETALFVAEGLEFAAKALTCGFKARHLLVDLRHSHHAASQQIVEQARSDGAQIAKVSQRLLSRISGKDNLQNLVLVAEQRWATALPARVRDSDVVLALDHVRDPRNLGAIVRTAEAAGVRMLVLVGSSCDPYAPEAVRAAAGSLFAVPVMKCTNDGFLELARDWSGDIIGADLAAAADFRQPRHGPVLLIMGNESDGVSEELSRVCTLRVRIPMMPGVSSLNLAAAAALLLYELRLPFIRR